MEHFGIKLHKRKHSWYLKREEFALINTKPSFKIVADSLIKRNAYTDDTGKEYRIEWCEEYRKLCLQNYDLNMQRFNSLNRVDFDNAVTTFLAKHKGFHEIDSLLNYDGVSGYYMMILDKYKQAYIGKSVNIKRRIHCHWTTTKAFDRTLFPMYARDTSVFSIDFFRALDTTRIYVYETTVFYGFDGIEEDLISGFPQEYSVNRLSGWGAVNKLNMDNYTKNTKE